jgi:uncharacterized protein
MSDGVRLKGYLIRPDVEDEAFPVLFEYHPYHATGRDRFARARYLAERGYVDAYFQVRGTGQSEGTLPDREYSEQEIQDGLDLIDWLSRQPWSTGKVGMYGFSWSACNAYAVADRRPPALKALWLGVCTDDLYNEDGRYMDGVLTFNDYTFFIDVSNAVAPYPDFALTEAYFRDRFDQPPWSLIYLRNQADGEFWQRGRRLDVRPDAMPIPAYAHSGWVDGYRSSVPRLLEQARTPTKALIGPWDHDVGKNAETSGQPGPHPEWRHEKVRWWDHWLKERDTGIMDEPRVTVYMRHSHPPEPWVRGDDPYRFDLPGEWRADDWPPQGLRDRAFYLSPEGGLVEGEPGASAVHQLRYVPTVGAQAGLYWGNVEPDQRPIDAFSLAYESGPLDEELAILGHPVAHLRASATAPLAHWMVRLLDVAPDGTTTLVTGGGLNGAHRMSSTEPLPLVPGEVYDLEVRLHATGWIFQPGHRIRVAVSNALWPMKWPSPYAMITSLFLGDTGTAAAGPRREPGSSSGEPGATRLVLPVVPPRTGRSLPEFVGIPREPDALLPGEEPRRFRGNPHGGGGGRYESILREEIDPGSGTAPQSTTVRLGGMTWKANDWRPAEAAVRGEASLTRRARDGRILTFEGVTQVRSDERVFYYRHERWVREDGNLVRHRVWEDTIPRFFH